jgi:hypothetical protein
MVCEDMLRSFKQNVSSLWKQLWLVKKDGFIYVMNFMLPHHIKWMGSTSTKEIWIPPGIQLEGNVAAALLGYEYTDNRCNAQIEWAAYYTFSI